MCRAEDEEDIRAATQAKAEQVAELAEFNENDGFAAGEGEEAGRTGAEDEEMSRAEQEIAALVEQVIFRPTGSQLHLPQLLPLDSVTLLLSSLVKIKGDGPWAPSPCVHHHCSSPQLTPIERYAMKFLEASLEEVSREELKQAEVSISRGWRWKWEAACFLFTPSPACLSLTTPWALLLVGASGSCPQGPGPSQGGGVPPTPRGRGGARGWR